MQLKLHFLIIFQKNHFNHRLNNNPFFLKKFQAKPILKIHVLENVKPVLIFHGITPIPSKSENSIEFII
jgi:hypothetical protein